MSFTLSTFRAYVDDLIDADDEILAEGARDRRIKDALRKYSNDAPDTEIDDVTGDDGRYYAVVSNLSEWSEGFSRIEAIEYPAATVADDEAPVYLEADDWRDDYWVSDTRYLYLPSHAPSTTETMRIEYTVPYEFSSSNEVSTPAQHFSAICFLAASYCCRAIATKFSKDKESTIALDSVHHTSKSMEYAARADEYMAMYREEMGLAGDGYGEDGARRDTPASAFIDWDTQPSEKRQYVWHSKETR